MTESVASQMVEVLMHHVNALATKQIDEVLKDYTEDSVIMVPERSYRGLAELRTYFQVAVDTAPMEMFQNLVVNRQDIQGEVFYVVWKSQPFFKAASDTFIIRDGKILVQTFIMVT